MNIIKCKLKYTEYTDKNKIVSTELIIPQDLKFYTFDSQFTIIEKS
jgi:hypothetical protein